MIKLRKSKLIRAICFLLAVSIFTISCDPNGDLMMSKSIDQQAQNILEENSSMMTGEECQTFVANVNAVKAYVWEVRSNGYSPSKTDIANFVYDLNVQNGIIEHDSEARAVFANIVSSNSLAGDEERIINNLYETQVISENLSNILQEFRTQFSEVESYEKAFDIIGAFSSSDLYEQLSEDEKDVFDEAMIAAESGVCYSMTDQGDAEYAGDDIEFRDLCWECVWELNWVKAIIAVVVTVVVWLLAVITFGLSTLVSSVISIAVWTAVWVLNCFWVECETSGPCPEGQEPFCETGFVLNLEAGLCEMLDGLEGAILSSSNCIWVDKLPNGDCPDGAMFIPGASQCLLVCFGDELPDGIGQNQDGQYVYPFECI